MYEILKLGPNMPEYTSLLFPKSSAQESKWILFFVPDDYRKFC
jgi:hypothetical protein